MWSCNRTHVLDTLTHTPRSLPVVAHVIALFCFSSSLTSHWWYSNCNATYDVVRERRCSEPAVCSRTDTVSCEFERESVCACVIFFSAVWSVAFLSL